MRILVVYDSLHSNTEKIALAVAGALGGDTRAVRAGGAEAAAVESADMVVLGAPTHGGRPSQPMQEFLARVPERAWQGKRVAAFDTRLTAKWVVIFGFAAPRMAQRLRKLGATLIAPPEGFFVSGGEGPLAAGEEERAAAWARGLVG